MRSMIIFLLFLTQTACSTFIEGSAPREMSLEPRTVDVAPNDIIRVVTPFEEPRVVTVSDAEIERSQNVLYVLFDGQEGISMFVTDSQNETWSINLTLKPTDGGVREINIAPMNQPLVAAQDTQVNVPKPADPDPWGRPCRLCRASDNNGQDGYSGSSW